MFLLFLDRIPYQTSALFSVFIYFLKNQKEEVLQTEFWWCFCFSVLNGLQWIINI